MVKGYGEAKKLFIRHGGKYLTKVFEEGVKKKVLEKYFLETLKGLPELYLKKGHTCSSKTKRLDIDVLIKYLNDKKKELSKNG